MGQILGSFVRQYYGQASYVPPEILLQMEPGDGEVLSSWLTSRRGGRVTPRMPKRGEKRKLVSLAVENAAQGVAQMRAKWMADAGRTGMSLKELAQWLDLASPPRRVECYDVSNVRGTSAVGSMAVFENGRPKPSEYRRFKIGTVAGIDDYAMMQEVLRRRFRKFQEEDGSSWAARPDLVVIDGGRGHLTAAQRALADVGVVGIPVVSLAKENEDVFLPGRSDPLRLPRDSQALYMLLRIRDEAHRFAISYHSRVRRKTLVSSALDLPGIGPKRKRALMRQFGSIRAIRAASVDEISAVPGITRAVAERLKEHL
jgi:excinuclease ABC subunit C